MEWSDGHIKKQPWPMMGFTFTQLNLQGCWTFLNKCECDSVYVRHWTYMIYWSKWQNIQNQSKWKQLGELAMGVGKLL